MYLCKPAFRCLFVMPSIKSVVKIEQYIRLLVIEQRQMRYFIKKTKF